MQVLPKAALTTLAENIQAIALPEYTLTAQYPDVPSQYVDEIIRPHIATVEASLRTLSDQIKKTAIDLAGESIKRHEGAIRIDYIVNEILNAHFDRKFALASVVPFQPMFDPLSPFRSDRSTCGRTLRDAMAGASEESITRVSKALSHISDIAQAHAKETTQKVIGRLRELFWEIESSQEFPPYFHISKSFYWFKGLFRPYLMKLLHNEMEKYETLPEVYTVYKETIALFTTKEEVTKKDFVEMVRKFPRQQMQKQAAIIEKINTSADDKSQIPISRENRLDTVVQMLSDARRQWDTNTFKQVIYDRAYLSYRRTAIQKNTLFNAEHFEKQNAWCEEVVPKNLETANRYTFQILDALIQVLSESDSITLHDLKSKVYLFPNDPSDSVDNIFFKSSDVHFHICSMLDTIFLEVITL